MKFRTTTSLVLAASTCVALASLQACGSSSSGTPGSGGTTDGGAGTVGSGSTNDGGAPPGTTAAGGDDGGGGAAGPGGAAPDGGGDDDDDSMTDASGSDGGGASDASDGASAPSDAATWSPSMLGAPLVMWLDADMGITADSSGVAGWADRTANHNDAISLGQSAQPQKSTLSGHSTIVFDGSTTYLQVADSTSLEVQAGYTIVVVARANASKGAQHLGGLYSKQNAASPYVGASLWINYNVGVPATDERAGAQFDINQYIDSSERTLVDGKLHVYSSTYDSTVATQNFTLRVDNGPLHQLTVSPNSTLGAVGSPAILGGKPSGTQTFLGEMSEVLVMNEAISSSDWASTYAYLQAKYSL